MGCSQSTERKPSVEQQMLQVTKIEASPVKVVVATKIASPMVEKYEGQPAANDCEAIHFEVASEQPSAVESVVPTPKAEAAEPFVAPVEEVVAAPAVAAAEEPVVAAIVAQPTPVPVFVAPAVPVLALASSRAKKPAKSPRAKAAASNDENAGSPLKAQSAVKKAFGASQTTCNVVAKKAVGFGAVPAPVTAATKQAKAKAQARKAAGKRAGNFDHEKFLEQCAMFERQLTHRASLDAHLNSR